MSRHLPFGLLFLSLLAWSGLVLVRVLPDPAGRVPHALFLPTQAWCFDHIAGVLAGQHDWSLYTDRIGGPNPVRLAFLAWAPAALFAPLTWLGGALLAANIAMLTLPIGAGMLTALWLRARGVAAPGAAAAGLLFATSLPMLSYLANGQVGKACLWILPLLCLDLELAPRSWLAVLLAPVVAFSSVFSEPTITLAALAALPFVAIDVIVRAPRRWAAAGRVGLALLPWVPALLLGMSYYRPGDAKDAAFTHAGMYGTSQLMAGSSASLLSLTWPSWELGGDQGVTISYLGLPCLLVVAWVLLRRLPGGLLATALVVAGAVMALGEYLWLGDELALFRGMPLTLPAGVLADLGFPMRSSGHYDRFVVTAWLGAAVGLAALVGARRRLALVAGAAVLVHSLGLGRGLWPLDTVPFEGQRELAGLAAAAPVDGQHGRLLDLPGRAGSFDKGMAMLRATRHRYPVDVLPRPGLRWGMANHALSQPLAMIRAGDSGAAWGLRQAGIVAVLWSNGPLGEGPSKASIEQALGPGEEVGPYTLWRLDSAGRRP